MAKKARKIGRCRAVDGALSAEMAAFSRRIKRSYRLESHHARLLQLACEAFDRSRQARELLARDGLTVETRLGEVKPHPAVAIERDSRIAFARLIRELGLSDEVDDARPPRGSIG